MPFCIVCTILFCCYCRCCFFPFYLIFQFSVMLELDNNVKPTVTMKFEPREWILILYATNAGHLHCRTVKMLGKLTIATFLMRNNVQRLSCHLNARGLFSGISFFFFLSKNFLSGKLLLFVEFFFEFNNILHRHCAICNAWLNYPICCYSFAI